MGRGLVPGSPAGLSPAHCPRHATPSGGRQTFARDGPESRAGGCGELREPAAAPQFTHPAGDSAGPQLWPAAVTFAGPRAPPAPRHRPARPSLSARPAPRGPSPAGGLPARAPKGQCWRGGAEARAGRGQCTGRPPAGRWIDPPPAPPPPGPAPRLTSPPRAAPRAAAPAHCADSSSGPGAPGAELSRSGRDRGLRAPPHAPGPAGVLAEPPGPPGQSGLSQAGPGPLRAGGRPSGRPGPRPPAPTPARGTCRAAGRRGGRRGRLLSRRGLRAAAERRRPWPAPYVKRRRLRRHSAEGGRRRAAAAPLRYPATGLSAPPAGRAPYPSAQPPDYISARPPRPAPPLRPPGPAPTAGGPLGRAAQGPGAWRSHWAGRECWGPPGGAGCGWEPTPREGRRRGNAPCGEARGAASGESPSAPRLPLPRPQTPSGPRDSPCTATPAAPYSPRLSGCRLHLSAPPPTRVLGWLEWAV